MGSLDIVKNEDIITYSDMGSGVFLLPSIRKKLNLELWFGFNRNAAQLCLAVLVKRTESF